MATLKALYHSDFGTLVCNVLFVAPFVALYVAVYCG
jgi:hypothetical protein